MASRTGPSLRSLPVWFLAALLVWAPLPFGSNRPLFEAILEACGFAALALVVLWPREADRVQAAGGKRTGGALVPFLALVGIAVLGVAQAIRLPASLVRALSPASDVIQRRAAALLLAEGGKRPASTLSLAPAASLDSALLWAAIAALFLASWLVCRGARGDQRRILALAILGAALMQVVYGVANIGTGTIWGIEVAPQHADRLRGTFANADHAALYLEMALAAALAWAWQALERLRHEEEDNRSRVLGAIAPVVIWLALFTGLAFTGSRAGLVAALVGALCQIAIISSLERRWRTFGWGLWLLTAGGVLVGIIGLQLGLGRWLATPAQELTWNNRLAAYRASFDLWRDFPWLGTGLGTFRDAFPLVQPPELTNVWTHAHNDVLELLLTTGMLGAALFLAGTVMLVRAILRRLHRDFALAPRAHALAAVGALAAVAVHSLVDFGLTIPANAATLAVICGGAAAARPRHGSDRSRIRIPAE